MDTILMYVFSADFLISFFRISTPLILCAMAALIVRKSGLVCIAFESMMLVAAFGGVVGSAFSNSLIIGMLAGLLSSVMIAVVFGYFVLILQANNMLVSLALNTFGSGGTVFMLYAFSGDRGSSTSLKSLQFPTVTLSFLENVPVIGRVFNELNVMTYVAIISVPLVYLLLFKTPLGLRIRVVGESPGAAESLGTSKIKMRFFALIIAGVLAGVAGMYMSMGYLPYFTRDMIAGRGFIAIAAQNLGGAMPFATMIWALVFGASGAIANAFQAIGIPPEFLQMFPYIATIAGLMLVGITENRKNAQQKNKLRNSCAKLERLQKTGTCEGGNSK